MLLPKMRLHCPYVLVRRIWWECRCPSSINFGWSTFVRCRIVSNRRRALCFTACCWSASALREEKVMCSQSASPPRHRECIGTKDDHHLLFWPFPHMHYACRISLPSLLHSGRSACSAFAQHPNIRIMAFLTVNINLTGRYAIYI